MEYKKKRIAYVHFAFIYSGGGEKLVLKQVEGLRQRGWQVDIWTPLLHRQSCFPDVTGKVEIKELLPGFSFLFRVLKINSLIYLFAFLSPLVIWRLRRYQLLLGDHHPSAWVCYLAWLVFRIPYLLYLAQPTRILYQRPIDREVGLQFGGPLRLSRVLGKVLRPLIFLLDQKCLLSAQAVVANGAYSQQALMAVYGREILSCPAGSDLSHGVKRRFFTGTLAVGRHMVVKPYILLTNRHIPQKRIDWMVAMMKRLAKLNTRLVITGAPTEYTKLLRQQVKRWRLEEKVLFVGLVTEPDLATLYQNAAVYVYSAPEEDFGMGVVEAQAHGCPVVAWRAGGTQYTVKDKQTGFLIKPYRLAAFAEAVRQLLTDRRLNRRMALSARDWAKSFSWEKHHRCLEKIVIQSLRG